jgi:hypothetical protein
MEGVVFPWAWVDSNYRPHAYQGRFQPLFSEHLSQEAAEKLNLSRNLLSLLDRQE